MRAASVFPPLRRRQSVSHIATSVLSLPDSKHLFRYSKFESLLGIEVDSETGLLDHHDCSSCKLLVIKKDLVISRMLRHAGTNHSSTSNIPQPSKVDYEKNIKHDEGANHVRSRPRTLLSISGHYRGWRGY